MNTSQNFNDALTALPERGSSMLVVVTLTLLICSACSTPQPTLTTAEVQTIHESVANALPSDHDIKVLFDPGLRVRKPLFSSKPFFSTEWKWGLLKVDVPLVAGRSINNREVILPKDFDMTLVAKGRFETILNAIDPSTLPEAVQTVNVRLYNGVKVTVYKMHPSGQSDFVGEHNEASVVAQLRVEVKDIKSSGWTVLSSKAKLERCWLTIATNLVTSSYGADTSKRWR